MCARLLRISAGSQWIHVRMCVSVCVLAYVQAREAASARRWALAACPRVATPQSTLIEALEQELAAQRPIPPDVDDLFKARSGGKQFQDVLRHALRHRLDFAVRPVNTYADGKQTVMDKKDMIFVYNRRREHMRAYRAMLQWALAQTKKVAWSPVACPEAACPLETPRVAIAFWHSTDGMAKQLPHAFSEGLASCVRNSGLIVCLLSYQLDCLGNIPDGVHLRERCQPPSSMARFRSAFVAQARAAFE